MRRAASLLFVLLTLVMGEVGGAYVRIPPTGRSSDLQEAVDQVPSPLNSEPKLKTVVIIHRHGDRNPIWMHASDPYADPKYWPEGWAQLTTAGKKRMLALGRFLRRRYEDFLTGHPAEVSARSSSMQRTTASAQLILAGAYPPNKSSSFDPDLYWQPIPVMHGPLDHLMLRGPAKDCAAAKHEAALIANSSDVRSFLAKKEKLFQTLSRVMGEKVRDLMPAMLMQDTLKVEEEQGLLLPDWATAELTSELQGVSEQFTVNRGMTVKNLRLYAGLFLSALKRDLSERLDPHEPQARGRVARPVIEEDGRPKRLHLYATSDGTVAPVLQALNVYDGTFVPYGAAVIFEHLQNKTVNWIRAFYLRRTETEELIPLKIRGCELSHDLCPLHTFFTAIEPYVVDDMDAECRVSTK